MGTLKKFASWLSDGSRRGKKSNASSMIIKLKMFVRRLNKQAKSLDFKSNRNRKKAIAARRKGDIEGSRMLMRHALQFGKWKHSVEAFALRLEGLQYKLEQAKAVEDFQGVLQGIASAVNGLRAQVSFPQISKLIEEVDFGIQDFDTSSELVAEGMDAMQATGGDAVLDDEVEEALAEVDANLMVEQGEKLPAPVSSDRISELEDEINQLKEDR